MYRSSPSPGSTTSGGVCAGGCSIQTELPPPPKPSPSFLSPARTPSPQRLILALRRDIAAWVDALRQSEVDNQTDGETAIPILGSVDTRQSRCGRVCAVDPNRYPQGFNNVYVADVGHCSSADTAKQPASAAPQSKTVNLVYPLMELDDDDDRAAASATARGVAVRRCPTGSALLRKRVDPARHHRIHVVEEDYADQHQFYQSLASLKALCSAALVDQNAPTTAPAAESRCAVTSSLRRCVAPGVFNVLDTSYPSDMRCPLNDEEWAEDAEGRVLQGLEQAGVLPPFHEDDPEWYNSYRKSELFSFIDDWLSRCPAAIRDGLVAAPGWHAQTEVAGASPTDDCALQPDAVAGGMSMARAPETSGPQTLKWNPFLLSA
eukprot:Hpha_TRINITY_DN18437_c0_g1::TRINITY_DN18437_c0_g1_i1::g.165343::m.165343